MVDLLARLLDPVREPLLQVIGFLRVQAAQVITPALGVLSVPRLDGRRLVQVVGPRARSINPAAFESKLAFDHLWVDRGSVGIAGIGCPVPNLPAQALLLILNAARSTGPRSRDLMLAWEDASAERREQIEALVHELDAPVAFAASVGGLEQYRGERDYRLWKVVSRGGGRSEEWWARVRAAPTLSESIRVPARAPLDTTVRPRDNDTRRPGWDSSRAR